MINNIPVELENTLKDILKMKLEAFIETAPDENKRKFWENALKGLPKVFKGITKDCNQGRIFRDWYYFTVALCYRIYFRSQQEWIEKNSDELADKVMNGDVMGAIQGLMGSITVLREKTNNPLETVIEIVNNLSKSIIYSLETVPGMGRISSIPKLSVLQDKDIVKDILIEVMNIINVAD